jgi:hypothetical protein
MNSEESVNISDMVFSGLMDWAPPDWQPPDVSKFLELRPHGIELKYDGGGLGTCGWVITGSVVPPANPESTLWFNVEATEARLVSEDFLRAALSALEKGLDEGQKLIYIQDLDSEGRPRFQ